MNRRIPINTVVPRELKTALLALAEKEGRTLSNYIEQVLAQKVESEKQNDQ